MLFTNNLTINKNGEKTVKHLSHEDDITAELLNQTNQAILNSVGVKVLKFTRRFLPATFNHYRSVVHNFGKVPDIINLSIICTEDDTTPNSVYTTITGYTVGDVVMIGNLTNTAYYSTDTRFFTHERYVKFLFSNKAGTKRLTTSDRIDPFKWNQQYLLVAF